MEFITYPSQILLSAINKDQKYYFIEYDFEDNYIIRYIVNIYFKLKYVLVYRPDSGEIEKVIPAEPLFEYYLYRFNNYKQSHDVDKECMNYENIPDFIKL